MVAIKSDTRRHLCPCCGGDLRRIPRGEDERQQPQTLPLRRYRCVQPGCLWEGLLPRQPSRNRSRRGRAAAALPLALEAAVAPTPPKRLRWWTLAPLMVAGLFSGVLAAVLVRGLAGSPPAIALVPGVHHEGVAISATHPLLQAPPSAGPEVERLTLKQGCAWAQPGRSPYRGDVEQALITARLPAEVVHRIALKVRSGQPDDRLRISNAAIRSERDAREFDARNFALTYGRTLCVNSRVNFKPGHSEPASLYEATDQQGRLHSVMVPDVCGNVSVLGVRMERRRAQVVPVLADPAGDSIAVLRTAWVDESSDGRVRQVPEPGTLASVLVALAAAAAVAGWRRRRGRAAAGETV
jgi:hypothetical protein